MSLALNNWAQVYVVSPFFHLPINCAADISSFSSIVCSRSVLSFSSLESHQRLGRPVFPEYILDIYFSMSDNARMSSRLMTRKLMTVICIEMVYCCFFCLFVVVFCCCFSLFVFFFFCFVFVCCCCFLFCFVFVVFFFCWFCFVGFFKYWNVFYNESVMHESIKLEEFKNQNSFFVKKFMCYVISWYNLK